ncbi:MAG: hypothetical protein FJ405_03565 [Verrucomicrobia bacterium]|nr:hypothetical protein [Verrucomicrobiota bacterium]
MGRIDNGDVKMAWTEVGTGAVEEKVFPQAEAAAAASAATRGATNTNVRSGAASAGNTRSRGNELDGFRPGMSGPEALITAIGIRANNRWNQAMEDDPEMGARKRHPQLTDQSGSRWAPSPEGALKFSRQLKEFKPVLRKTMEDAPTKSALEDPVGQAQTAKVANEVLNEMRRENTGGVEVDDKSIYLAKLELHKPTGAPVKWESDVTSPPEVTVLSSLILLMADTTIHVFDANLQKLWQTQLAYPMDRAASGWSLGGNDEGIAITEPMIERGDTLYLIDPGSLGAYDKVTGAAKWRLPSVGISRLIFDEQGNIFIDTTTMGQQQLRLTDQIDIGRKDRRVVMKVVAASGKVLWRTENCGSIAALEGKYVYSSETVTSGGGPLNPDAIPVTQLLICRLHHKSGKLLWEHASRGYPESVDFLNNQFLILRTNRLDVIRFGMF